MVDARELIRALDDLLQPHAFDDMGPNGLQVPGTRAIERVATGVTAQRALFERAIEQDAQLVLVHHGLFWNFAPVGLTRLLAERLRPLFRHDVALAAYHLPLDAHPEVGNNALICEALGLRRGEPFAEVKGRSIGFVGHAAAPIGLDRLVDRCRQAFGRDPLVLPAGDGEVARVGVVSGGGGSSLAEAADLGLDALVTGEPEEPSMADAAETGVSLIAGGHYATETFGVRRLGELVAERFGVEHRFVEVPNPV
ncbi:MAG TPA: Nif3-like dinuclear metal center hexameric protein [Thermoleophilaceae bacterium]